MARILTPAGPSIRKLVELKLKSERKVVPLKAQSWLRCSSLPMMCGRAEVLSSRLKIQRTDKIKPDLQLTFDLGHGMHWAFQNRVAPKLDIIFGRWRCLRCGACYGGFNEGEDANAIELPQRVVRRPSVCQSATCLEDKRPRDEDTCDFEYVEQFFGDKQLRLGGHPDAFLIMEDAEGLGMGELKSCSERKHKEIKDCPDFGHVIQLQAYMMLTGLKWGMLLYWCKALFNAPLVEHYVERDEDTIDQVKAMIHDIWDGVKTGSLPERICSSADCNRAEECDVVEPCFEYEEKVA
jgi:hypothetical protein